MCAYPDEVVSKHFRVPKASSTWARYVVGLVQVRSCPSSAPTLRHCQPLLYLAVDKDRSGQPVCSTAKPCAATDTQMGSSRLQEASAWGSSREARC